MGTWLQSIDPVALAMMAVLVAAAAALGLWSWRRTAQRLAASNTRLREEMRQRESAQQALQSQQQRTDALLQSVQDGIVAYDAQGRIEWFNPAAEAMLRCPVEKAHGHPVAAVLPLLGTHLPGERAGTARLPLREEMQAQRLDGEPFPLELSLTELWVQGRPLMLAVLRDLVDQHRIERMQRDFVTVVSHELRTPLTSIRGALGLLAGGSTGELSPPAARMVQIARDNAGRLVNLVNDILDAERLASGRMALHPEILDATLALRELAESMEGYARLHGVAIVTPQAEPGQLWVDVDPERLHQVLANLVSNAIKHSPADGAVELAVGLHEGAVRFVVTDHGPGLPADFHERVFTPFAQADASDSRVTAGSGLGLSIAKGLVERMGGQIGFDSPAGGPTRFWVDLRLSPAPVAWQKVEGSGLDDLIV